jgi:DNA topoisomerase IB
MKNYILLIKKNLLLFEYKNNTLIPFEKYDQYKHIGLNYPYMIINNNLENDLIMLAFDSKFRIQYKYDKTHYQESLNEKIKKLKQITNNYLVLIKNINRDIISPNYNLQKILSVITLIIITTGIRVGKDYHFQQTKSKGLSTIQIEDVLVKQNIIEINFIGKKQVKHKYIFKKEDDKIIFDTLKYLYILNKENSCNFLFTFNNKKITYIDINKYLKEKCNDDSVSNKDFRTLLSNIKYIECIKNYINEKKYNDLNFKKMFIHCNKFTADILHNTESVAKKYYIFDIINNYIIDHFDDFIKIKDNYILLNIILKE